MIHAYETSKMDIVVKTGQQYDQQKDWYKIIKHRYVICYLYTYL